MSNAHRAWRASFTRRWHQNADLCDTHDTDAGHQGRVALLILSIFPDASRTLLAHAITHDQGEAAVGDISYDAKRMNPDLAEIVAVVERQEIAAQGFALPSLTDREKRMLKLCDHLDAWLWMQRHARHLAKREDWREQKDDMLSEATRLAVWRDVMKLVDAEECRV